MPKGSLSTRTWQETQKAEHEDDINSKRIRLIDSVGDGIDILPIKQVLPNSIGMFSEFTAGLTALKLPFSEEPIVYIIKADKYNNGNLYLGTSTVKNDGTLDFVKLERGDEIIDCYDNTTNHLYLIADQAGQLANIGEKKWV